VRRLVKFVLALFLLAVAGGFAAYRWSMTYLESPVAITSPLVFTVARGAPLNAVGRELHARGAMPHPRIWVLYARARGVAGRIHAGEYQILPGATPVTILRQLVDGAVMLRQITVVEGATFHQFLDLMRHHPSIHHTLADVSDEEIMRRLGKPGVHPEGQFFPDTYRFAAGTDDLEILRQAHAQLEKHLAAAWAQRSTHLPFSTPYEALILASMVEKETGLPSERSRIAGVFVRRLRSGMRLQSDPTVIYGMGEAYAGNIRRRDLRGDTAYNTYTRAGLPPTPIALPSEGALQAATRPDDRGAIYFVATGEPDGSHFFSATLAEHNAAVRRFLARTRQRAAPGTQ
jgi:UPF0755 protein